MFARIIDVCTADYGVYNKLGKIFPAKALGDKLCKPGKIIIFNPVITFLVVLVVYPLICLLILPFFMISFILSSPGSWFVFFSLIIFGTRSFARTMIFPGSLQSVQRNVSQEYLKGIMGQLERISSISSNMSIQIIGLVTSGNTKNCQLNMEDITVMSDKSLPRLLLIIKEGIDDLPRSATDNCRRALENLYSSGCKLYSGLRSLVDVLQAYTYLHQVVSARSNELSVATMACIDASSEVNAALLEIKSLIGASSNKAGGDHIGVGGYFSSIKANLTEFFRANNGLEQASFPMMRKHICVMFPSHSSSSLTHPSAPLVSDDMRCPAADALRKTRVRRLTLTGSDGHTIDAIMVYAHDIENDGDVDSFSTPLSHPDVPTVLFCPPNAGFYECLAMSQPGGSWLWFYANMHGMNVCVFNYRGYGASTGVPDPSRIQNDGVCVANHLIDKLHVKTLILHGESVGGLVACHIAKSCRVAGLVCDRTFSSLDAVSRRMLGDWAGLGLNTLGRWRTASLDNYLGANCMKIVIQDPDDEIVFHTASLKVGIACRLLLGDSCRGSIPGHSREYRVAEALGLPVSLLQSHCAVNILVDTIIRNTDKSAAERPSVSLDGSVSEMASLPLTEEFVEHLAACIVGVARRAAYEEMQRVKRQMRLSESRVDSSDMEMGGTEENAPLASHSLGLAGGMTTEDSVGYDNDDMMSPTERGEKETGVMSPAPLSNPRARARTTSSASSSTSPDHSLSANSIGPNSVGARKKISGVDKWAQMEVFCSQSIHDSALTMPEKFWLALSRTDGYCGQLLGQAVSGGLDGIRAWIVCCVVWGAVGCSDDDVDSIPRRDSRLPASRATLCSTIQDFEVLINQLGSSQQLDSMGAVSGSRMPPIIDDSVAFIHRAFRVLEIRRKEISRGMLSSLHINEYKYAIRTLPAHGSTDMAVNKRQRALYVGDLISVHCGHNGFPLKEELSILSEFVNSVVGAGRGDGEDGALSY